MELPFRTCSKSLPIVRSTYGSQVKYLYIEGVEEFQRTYRTLLDHSGTSKLRRVACDMSREECTNPPRSRGASKILPEKYGPRATKEVCSISPPSPTRPSQTLLFLGHAEEYQIANSLTQTISWLG